VKRLDHLGTDQQRNIPLLVIQFAISYFPVQK
jgi:hypothetical protein